MREALFTEQIHLFAPPGMLDTVKAAAKEEGQTASEFIRQAIRDQLRRTGQVDAAHAAAGD